MTHLIIQIGKTYRSQRGRIVYIQSELSCFPYENILFIGDDGCAYDTKGVAHQTAFCGDNITDDPLIELVETDHSKAVRVDPLLMSSLMRTEDLNVIYRRWFDDIITAWLNPVTHNNSYTHIRDIRQYLSDYASNENRDIFMNSVMTAFETLMHNCPRFTEPNEENI